VAWSCTFQAPSWRGAPVPERPAQHQVLHAPRQRHHAALHHHALKKHCALLSCAATVPAMQLPLLLWRTPPSRKRRRDALEEEVEGLRKELKKTRAQLNQVRQNLINAQDVTEDDSTSKFPNLIEIKGLYLSLKLNCLNLVMSLLKEHTCQYAATFTNNMCKTAQTIVDNRLTGVFNLLCLNYRGEQTEETNALKKILRQKQSYTHQVTECLNKLETLRVGLNKSETLRVDSNTKPFLKRFIKFYLIVKLSGDNLNMRVEETPKVVMYSSDQYQVLESQNLTPDTPCYIFLPGLRTIRNGWQDGCKPCVLATDYSCSE